MWMSRGWAFGLTPHPRCLSEMREDLGRRRRVGLPGSWLPPVPTGARLPWGCDSSVFYPVWIRNLETFIYTDTHGCLHACMYTHVRVPVRTHTCSICLRPTDTPRSSRFGEREGAFAAATGVAMPDGTGQLHSRLPRASGVTRQPLPTFSPQGSAPSVLSPSPCGPAEGFS